MKMEFIGLTFGIFLYVSSASLITLFSDIARVHEITSS